MQVRIQVIKVYDIEVSSLEEADRMSSLKIEADGKLVDVTTDYAEIVDDEDTDGEDEAD